MRVLGGQEELKRLVGYAAADEVSDDSVVGLGTGSTAKFAIERLGQRVKEGLRIVGIPTSIASQELAASVGIPLATLADHDRVDVTIDGADEVDPNLDLIKGGGGALLREKIVASVTARQIIIVDESKVVDKLGTTFALPVEVLEFGARQVAAALPALGCTGAVRGAAAGAPFRTDGGNLIIDCTFPGGIDDPPAIERAINIIPGVVDNGLFLGRTSLVLVGSPNGIRRLTPSS